MNILDILFPKNCLECKKSGKYICSECLAKVERAKLICPVCKKYSFSGKTHSFCIHKHALNGMHSFYKYEGVVRKAILKLKYNFASDVAGELVDSLKMNSSLKNAILVPVPLHRTRENWRGFNQAAILGKKLAEKENWIYEDQMVLRLENTTPQARLGREERLRNISGKFAVNANASLEALAKWDISNKTVVIFDDVWTTGATISEICKELKKIGVKEVWGMSVARS